MITWTWWEHQKDIIEGLGFMNIFFGQHETEYITRHDLSEQSGWLISKDTKFTDG